MTAPIPPSGRPALSLRGVEVLYGRRAILSGITLRPFAAGEVVALVGPNGAGKSTLLKAIAGIVRASGSIAVGAVELTTASPERRARHIGFMPQMSALGAQLTVLESIVTAAVVGRGIDTATARRAAAEMLDRLDLSAIAFRSLASLSGGQRQLASFAQALVRDPDILLLDEPTSALDLRYQLRVMSMARDVARSGRIVVAVLHDLALAAQFADRIVVVSAGRVAADGTPADVVTTGMLREVYGIVARVEHGTDGRLRIFAESEWAAPDGARVEAPR